MSNDERIRVAASERLFDVELAEALDVRLAVASSHERSQRRALWLAAATVLLGVFVAAGVAWLRAREDANAAQEPAAFDAVWPAFEQWHAWVHVVGQEALTRVADDVTSLDVQLDDLDGITAVARCVGLRHLFLTVPSDGRARGLLPATWRMLGALPQLESLYLPHDLQIRAVDLRELRTAPKLASLLLGGRAVVLDANLAAALVELQRLSRLQLFDVEVTPAGLAGLAGLPGLEVLELGRADLSPAAIAAIAKLRQLRVVTLMGGPPRGGSGARAQLSAEQMQQLASLPRLAVLGLQNCAVDASALAKLPPSLQWLGLEDVDGLTVAGIESLTRLKHLRTLSLGRDQQSSELLAAQVKLVRTLSLERFDCRNGTIGAAMWEALQRQPKLRGLAMRCPDDAAPDLSPCAKLPALERLILFFPKDLSPENLAPLRDHPKLRQVIAMCNPRLSSQQVAELRSCLGPRIEVQVQ